MRRFELVEGTSAKFWQVCVDGADVTTRWGRIGTNGQTKTKESASAAAAEAEARKLIDQKTKKGYVEVAAEETEAPAAAAAPAPKPVVDPEPSAVEDTPGGVPPWLDGGDPVDLDDQFRELAYPTRAHPRPLPGVVDHPPHGFGLGRTVVADLAATPSEAHEVLRAGVAAETIDALTPDGAVGALVLGTAARLGAGFTMRRVVERFGAVEATRALIASYRYTPNVRWSRTKGEPATVSFDLGDTPYRGEHRNPLGDAESMLRHVLAAADEADYEAAVRLVREAWPSLTPFRQAGLALAVPDLPELTDELIATHGADKPTWLHWLQATASTLDLAQVAARVKVEDYWRLGADSGLVHAMVLEKGSGAVAWLAPYADVETTGAALVRIGTPEAVGHLVAAAHSGKDAMARLNEAVRRWPVAATAGLAVAAASGGRSESVARAALTPLVAEEPGRVDLVRDWVSPAAAAVLDGLLVRFSADVDEASDEELPRVLAAPPWLEKRPREKPILIDPLPWEPVERWAAGQREQWLATKAWAVAHGTLKNVEAVAQALCESRYSWQDKQVGADQVTAMADAFAVGDAQAAASAFGEWAAAQKAENRYSSAVVRSFLLVEQAAPVLDKVRPDLGLEVWNLLAGTAEDDYDVKPVVARRGVAALPGLARVIRRRPADELATALPFGSVELAPLMARAFHQLKTVREDALAWLLAHPDYAAAGLIAPALGKHGAARDAARAALQRLGADHREAILDVARRYGRDDVLTAVQAMLDADDTENFPTRLPKLPAWWAPAGWSRPRLADGKALPLAAVDYLGTMLMFPVVDDQVYPGIAQVVEACDRASLAEFGWDLFSTWLAAGGVAKDAWAMTSLGFLGDDETARRITPYLRAWPGESQHKRAVTGLSVLAGIGTDLALMQLNGIATKVKFKALQNAARERIDQIAEQRGLTTEELEDRLAPDLGLSESGTMTLDFGPRCFTVGFDEALKPFVRDGEGARLKELPKPRQSDDAELSKAATATWRALKKDARAVASQQVLRLEVAMCVQRRWPLATFDTFLAGHPLVRHLVHRVVWAAYDADDRPVTFFRVAEDGERTDADDEPITLGDDVVVGIPHPLEIPDAVAAAFGQLFTDYELLQPFDQLSRESFTLTDEELAATSLTRWADQAVPVGKVLGLTNRGWQRGTPADGGVAGYVEKPLGPGLSIVAQLDPGLFTGYLDDAPEQTVTAVQAGDPSWWGEVKEPKPLSTLSPIAISELVRDLEGLRG
ncbi:MAG: DUF4132 domain-containing protein [Aeromicrobium sp.]|uniref:DUF4132 domain-containing protein n=1 Tax=Aeromicrobium sp. TaxID=1871063 RepID=UPI0039E4EF4A